MSGRRAMFLTGRREIRELLRSRAFIISTLIQIGVVLAVVIVSSLSDSNKAEDFDVGYVGADAERVVAAAGSAEDAFDAHLTAHPLADVEAARTAVADDEVDAVVTPAGLITEAEPSDSLVALLQAASANLRSADLLRERGLTDAEIAAALRPPPLPVEETGPGTAATGIAFLGSLILYFAILSSGLMVAAAVVTEKNTRVVEVLLAAISPRELLAGKVLGIGLLTFAQVMVIVGTGVAAALALGSLDLPSSTAAALALVAVYFVGGYLMYASAYAVAGASVSRQEDVQNSSGPLTILLIATYIASASALESPEGTLATVCTFLPPTAPMVVPGRAAQDALPAWQLVVSLILLAAATVVLVWAAARIYRRAVLRMGAPIKLRQALRLAKS